MRLGSIGGMELDIGIEHIIRTEYIFLALRIHGQRGICSQRRAVVQHLRSIAIDKRVIYADIAVFG